MRSKALNRTRFDAPAPSGPTEDHITAVIPFLQTTAPSKESAEVVYRACMQAADKHTEKKQKMSSVREVIATSNAPAAIGPYSQAIKAGGFIFVSGCIGLSPETKAIVPGGVGPECRQVLNNMKAVLEAAGSDMSKVCKTTILLKDMASFAEVNGIYGEYFSAEAGYPARATFAVAGLPLGALVEIEAVALA